MNFNKAVEKVEQMNKLEKNMLLSAMINQTNLSKEEKKVIFDKIFKDERLKPRQIYD